MTLTANDMSVFILTYDRPDLLETQLKSLLRQTCRPEIITVLDNGGLEETKDLVKRYFKCGARHVDTSSLGRLGNMLTAQALATGRYVALFHDDDVVHPQYLGAVLQVLNAHLHDDIRVVVCNYAVQRVGEFYFDSRPPHTNGLILPQHRYAAFLLNCYSGFPFAFYSTAVFRSLDICHLWSRYGKYLDIPILLESVGSGRVAFLAYPFAVYGKHDRQDAVDRSTLPTPEAWISLVECYSSVLGDSLMTIEGWSKIVFIHRMLITGFRRRSQRLMSKKAYWRKARERIGQSRHRLLVWMLSRRYFRKLFTRGAKIYFMQQTVPLCPTEGPS